LSGVNSSNKAAGVKVATTNTPGMKATILRIDCGPWVVALANLNRALASP